MRSVGGAWYDDKQASHPYPARLLFTNAQKHVIMASLVIWEDQPWGPGEVLHVELFRYPFG